MMAHYGLSAYGLDIGQGGTPDSNTALATVGQDANGGVGIAVGSGIQSPIGGANISGRISVSMLMLAVVGIVAFTYKTRRIQL